MTSSLELKVASMRLERGDILVVRGPMELAKRGSDLMRSLAPDGVRVLFIPPEVELSVLTRKQIEEMAA
jgi:hypothetical protein